MIRNESKQTISTSGRLESLQMVSRLDTAWCAAKDVQLPKKGLRNGKPLLLQVHPLIHVHYSLTKLLRKKVTNGPTPFNDKKYFTISKKKKQSK